MKIERTKKVDRIKKDIMDDMYVLSKYKIDDISKRYCELCGKELDEYKEDEEELNNIDAFESMKKVLMLMKDIYDNDKMSFDILMRLMYDKENLSHRELGNIYNVSRQQISLLILKMCNNYPELNPILRSNGYSKRLLKINEKFSKSWVKINKRKHANH